MQKYTITYAITGGMTIEANTEEEAIEKFNAYPEYELYENANPSEITDIVAEEPE